MQQVRDLHNNSLRFLSEVTDELGIREQPTFI